MRTILASFFIVFTSLFILACQIGQTNPLPPDDGTNEVLIVKTSILPPRVAEEGFVNWVKILKGTPWASMARNERFPLVAQKNACDLMVYTAQYNMNQGRNVTERFPEILQRERAVMLFEIPEIIEVIAYLTRHVPTAIYQYVIGKNA